MIGRTDALGLLAASALLGACGGDSLGVAPRAPPRLDAAVAARNPHNALSAVVTVHVRGADSAGVRFAIADDREAQLTTTPAVPVVADEAAIPVLGLLPARRYRLDAVAYGSGGTAVSGALELVTDTLPADLPRYVAGGTDPAPGYVVFAAGRYALVIDNTGRVVWYRAFPNGAGLAFMAQPTGRYFARPPGARPTDPAPWVELDPLGNITHTFGCASGLTSRLHDVIARPDGTYWLMCDETRTMDLSGVGGVGGARVTGTGVQHITREGVLLFAWSPFDHLAVADGDPRDRAGASVNWTHGNALDLAPDGNLIVSFRNLGEITKIDVRTGAVLWRLGGRRNQFTYLGVQHPPFTAQHGARAFAPGALLLLDNLGQGESRAERYELNENTRTARLVQSFGPVPGVVTEIGGSVQVLPGGRTLVSFGTAGRVEEYDASGRVTWRIEPGAGYIFRAQRISSLYAPGVGAAR